MASHAFLLAVERSALPPEPRLTISVTRWMECGEGCPESSLTVVVPPPE
jgi:hypothetical protein